MIFKSALITAAALVLVALLTGKDIIRQRVMTLAGKRYELTRYSNETLDVVREDGLHFVFDLRSGGSRLQVGTEDQMQDALGVIRQMAADQLSGTT